MMTKHYSSNFQLQQKILSGVDLLADYVSSTLGPRGRNVILKNAEGNPIITKDGVSVAEFISLEDPFEDAAVQIIKQASRKTNSEAGDGTTTATVLSRAILTEAFRHITAGASPVEVKRGIDHAVELIVARLREVASPIRSEKDVTHIATISANNDDVIGRLVAKAITSAGKDGSLIVEEARSTETTLDLIEGFRFDSGYAAGAFVNDERRNAVVYEDCFVLVVDDKIDKVQDLLPVLEPVAREGRPLVVVASEIEGQALAALIMNAMRGTMKVAAVKAPRYGQERRDILQDLCIASGAKFFSKASNTALSTFQLVDLGQCKKVEILKNGTTIIGAKGDWNQVEARIESLKAELEQTDNIHEGEQIQERIVRLASGVAVIKVGAATEVEMIEKKHRIEDAVEAVKAARMEGIVPGGGTALLKIVSSLPAPSLDGDKLLGYNSVVKACYAPIRQMASNSGLSSDIIIERVSNTTEVNQGWNFVSNEIEDLVVAGVVDPAKVTRCALQNAASAAGTLITSGHAVVERT
jgi:chaperonin GroEL